MFLENKKFYQFDDQGEHLFGTRENMLKFFFGMQKKSIAPFTPNKDRNHRL